MSWCSGAKRGARSATKGSGARTSRNLGRIALAALSALLATGCDKGPERYGVLHDAGLSADEKTLLVLVEHGTTTTNRGGLWAGDTTNVRPETMQVHEFERSSGKPGRVLSHPPPAESGRAHDRLADYAVTTGAPVASLKDCRALYTECAATTTPHPYRISRRVFDPQAGRTIEWSGRKLVVSPFAAMDAVQIRAARDALLRRSVEQIHTAAMKDFATRASKEDPERIETTETGAAETDAAMTASYRLTPGRIVHGRFDYPERKFFIVWDRDGACVTDSSAAVALVIGCHASDEGGLARAARGIARARPPDPDRTGMTWGVIATSDEPLTPLGSVTVACHGLPRETADKPCTQDDGNTACRRSFPMLCSRADVAFAAKSPWARRLALTAPVRGTELLSVGVADQICRGQLGDGWKMTEVDELGYKYQVTGIGSLPATSRFWVRNGDGPANCW